MGSDKKLRAALRPFVFEAGDTFDALYGKYTDDDVCTFSIKMGQLRAAAAAIRDDCK